MFAAFVIAAASAVIEVQQAAGHVGIDQISTIDVLEFGEAALGASVAQ